MPFNVLLLPLLGGYIFITHWNRTRFNAKRHTGERLLFEAATAGLLFLLIAFVLVHLVTAADPALHDRWAKEVPFPYRRCTTAGRRRFRFPIPARRCSRSCWARWRGSRRTGSFVATARRDG